MFIQDQINLTTREIHFRKGFFNKKTIDIPIYNKIKI
ncbi:PH domain-containing protein [Candidatus Roizmanbacteria bacterium]|nr:PH domain-containing protein [Candidatus Roizmanbacteria bacterium]